MCTKCYEKKATFAKYKYTKIAKLRQFIHQLFSSLRITFEVLSSNVLGNIFGNSLTATGSKNSMNGIIRKTITGTNRNKSATVLRN